MDMLALNVILLLYLKEIFNVTLFHFIKKKVSFAPNAIMQLPLIVILVYILKNVIAKFIINVCFAHILHNGELTFANMSIKNIETNNN